MSEIVNQELGPEANLKLEGVNGKLKLSVVYNGSQADAELAVMVDPGLLVDKLGALIPGDSSVEKGALELIKAALRAAL